jgi:hypothetical protein
MLRTAKPLHAIHDAGVRKTRVLYGINTRTQLGYFTWILDQALPTVGKTSRPLLYRTETALDMDAS